MFKKLLIVSFLLASSTIAFAQNKSVYSDLTPKNCKTVSMDQGMPGNYYGKCEGVGEYDLEYYLNDERNSLGVVFPSKKVVGLNFWNYFRNFSELGTKAEWRMKKNKPVALIVRLDVSDPEDGTKKTPYLIVTKISEENACVTDVIKPGKNQNVKARQLADKASNKKCMPGFIEEVDTENETSTDTERIDSVLNSKFDFSNCESLMLEFDSYSVSMENDPSAMGYIIINGDQRTRRNNEQQIKAYIRMRRLDFNRYMFVKGSGDSTAEIEFWLVPNGAKPPAPEIAVNESTEKFEMPTKPFIFTEEFDGGVSGCTVPLDVEGYIAVLKQYPKSRGNIVIFQPSKIWMWSLIEKNQDFFF